MPNVALHFTPTHQRMMAILGDCEPHSRQELVACLWDNLSDPSTVNYHISTLRRVLKPRNESIRTIREGPYVTCYQLVRVLSSSYDE